MNNNNKTREQLLKDLEKSNKRITELEKSETERKQAEEALRESEEQYRLITENTSDLITLNTLDLKASYTYVSPSIKAMSGYEPEDMLGKSAFEFIHPDDKKNLFPLLKKYVNLKIKKLLTGKEIPLNETIEYRSKDKSGNWRFFQSTGNIIGDQLLFVTRDITERKRAEEALQESEKQLQALIDAMPDYVCFKDGDGRWLKANDAGIRIFHLEGIDYQGKKDSELAELNSNLRGTFLTCEETDARAWKGEGLFHGEETIPDPDGSVRVYDVIKVAVFQPSGKRKGLVILGHDITKRKQAEEELRESEKRFRSYFEMSLIGMAITSVKKGWIDANNKICEILGYSLDELKQKTWVELTHPDDLDTDMEKFNQVLENRIDSYSMEKRFIRKNGALVFTKISVGCVRNSDGSVNYIVLLMEDITDRKIDEIVIRKSEERWQFALEGSGDGVWDWSVQLNEVFFSKQWKAMLGFKEDEISENMEEWDKRIHPDDIEKVHEDIQKHLDGKTQVYENEHRIRCKDGSYKWIYSRGKVISRTKEEKPLRMIGTHSDITGRKRAELELDNHREHLEDLIKERTDEVERSQKSLVLLMEDVNEVNKELKRVNTILDATNTELEAFSYSVSHDLRAPLTRMDGFSKALIDSYSNKMDDKAVHFLNRIRASSQHMAQLIDDLLSLSRITRQKVFIQKVDMSQTAGKIAEELKASESGRKVNFEIVKGLSANADRKFIEIVLMNLLSNAFKFTGKKKNAIIEFDKKIIDNKEVFFIKDNGAGFNMKYYDKIFTAFQRLHSEKEFKGTGIGLAIVQRIINKHGGKIWAESEEDKGTTFYFRFE